MIEEFVSDEGVLLAIVVRSSFDQPGLSFMTKPDGILQVGYMSYQAGHIIPAHVHLPYIRQTEGTQEVLFVRSGEVQVDLFAGDRKQQTSLILRAGDLIVLVSGGHRFELLKNSSIFEVKNGPYAGDFDKERFEHKKESADATGM